MAKRKPITTEKDAPGVPCERTNARRRRQEKQVARARQRLDNTPYGQAVRELGHGFTFDEIELGVLGPDIREAITLRAREIAAALYPNVFRQRGA